MTNRETWTHTWQARLVETLNEGGEYKLNPLSPIDGLSAMTLALPGDASKPGDQPDLAFNTLDPALAANALTLAMPEEVMRWL